MGGRGGKAFSTGSAARSEAFFGLNNPSGMFPSWRSGISLAEYNALRAYTGSDYISINNALRGDALSYASSETRDYVDQMTRAIDSFDLKKSMFVYRGSSGDILGGDKTAAEINAMAKAGAMIRDKGFLSTSASSEAHFYGEYKFIIKVPAGKGRGAYVAPLSHFRSENEFLLQRNTTFKIVRAVDKGGYTEVHLTVIKDQKK